MSLAKPWQVPGSHRHSAFTPQHNRCNLGQVKGGFRILVKGGGGGCNGTTRYAEVYRVSFPLGKLSNKFQFPRHCSFFLCSHSLNSFLEFFFLIWQLNDILNLLCCFWKFLRLICFVKLSFLNFFFGKFLRKLFCFFFSLKIVIFKLNESKKI